MIIQVAALALLLVLEALCTQFVIAHFINIVCSGVVHHCSHTAHTCIHDDKLVTCYKDVKEHYRACNGNSSAHVQGRQQLDWILLLSGQHLPIMIMYCNTHVHVHYW